MFYGMADKRQILAVLFLMTGVVLLNRGDLSSSEDHHLTCDGRRECHFIVDNNFFVHDPCPGTKKYLDVTYTCIVEGTSSWRCTDDGLWSEDGPNTMECQSDWTIQRQDALEETIKDQDASGIPELIVNDDHNTLRGKEMWRNWPSKKRQTFATRLLGCVERTMTSGSFTVHSSENYVQPLVMTEMSESIKTSSQPSNYFLFPSMALWAGENNVDSVDIPKEALELAGLDRSRVYYASYANIGDEMEPPVEQIPPSEQNPEGGERRRRIVSRVVAASVVIDGRSVRLPSLPRPIIITFHHHPETLRRMSSPQCVWWSMEDLQWSPSGCMLQSHNSTHTVCACNHMTHFAVLMDYVGHEVSTMDSQLLTFITYAGCTLSIICLIVTFLCFVIFVKGGGDRVFIHKNLCASLCIAELVFLAGIWRTEEKFECSVIAGSLLYFFLSALTWMLLEGYQLYQMLVEVFPAARRRLTFFLIGYGVPAIITVAAAYYDPTGFGTRHHCWLRTDNLFILFFVAPAAIILLTNTMFLLMTMCIVYRHSKYIPCRHATDNGGDIRYNLGERSYGSGLSSWDYLDMWTTVD
ncbi:hypothetical protein OESDEN_09233 [Oesophagostomum dentatum]|uniref:Latrophilin/CL-1-like GPS domain protein n=1 Tax=Oesophagostomum dentatum TaxID=61180 RepID=A0A0B1T430_OESDE|nr:hypothetical protein OESDEN_09233 [Oesophagostomum dentatum]